MSNGQSKMNQMGRDKQVVSESEKGILEWLLQVADTLEKKSKTVFAASLVFLVSLIAASLVFSHTIIQMLSEKTRQQIELVMVLAVASLFPVYFISLLISLVKLKRDASRYRLDLQSEKESLKQQYDNFIAQQKAERDEYNKTVEQYIKSYERSIEKLESAHDVVILIQGNEHIRTELASLTKRYDDIIFYGDFTLEYADQLKDYLGTKLKTICDRLPVETYPDEFFAKCNYRYWHQGFDADLFVFKDGAHTTVSVLIFSGRALALRMNFGLDECLNMKPENFPLLSMKEQVSRQIKAFHNPLVRINGIGGAELITEEFSFVLDSINNGYFKPITPPAHFDEWNKRIFDNFVDYASMKLDQARKLYITWKFDPRSTESLKYAYKFSGWIDKLNTGEKDITRLILVRQSDLKENTEKFERYVNVNNKMTAMTFNSFKEIVEDVCNEVILKNKTNPNYKIWYVNSEAHGFPAGLWKDFAVFMFDGVTYEIIQDSSYDEKTAVLKLFFQKVQAPSDLRKDFETVLSSPALLKSSLQEIIS